MTELTELVVGRRSVRPRDAVRIRPSKPGRRDGFVGVLRRIVDTPAGVEVEVFGARAGRVPSIRTFPSTRVMPTTATPTHREAR